MHDKSLNQLQKYVSEVVVYTRELFDLVKWDITIKFMSLDCKAQVNIDEAYRMATLCFDISQHTSEEDMADTIRHEMLHIVMNQYELVHAIQKASMGDEFKPTYKGYENAEELTINHLEFILSQSVKLSPKGIRQAVYKRLEKSK